MIGSDGIFDKISTEECVKIVMQEANEVVRDHSHISSYDPEQFENVSEISGICTDKLLTSAMESESLDNLSVVIITFNNFTSYLHNIMQFIANQPTLADRKSVV